MDSPSTGINCASYSVEATLKNNLFKKSYQSEKKFSGDANMSHFFKEKYLYLQTFSPVKFFPGSIIFERISVH